MFCNNNVSVSSGLSLGINPKDTATPLRHSGKVHVYRCVSVCVCVGGVRARAFYYCTIWPVVSTGTQT